jgi:hypothetical protein
MVFPSDVLFEEQAVAMSPPVTAAAPERAKSFRNLRLDSLFESMSCILTIPISFLVGIKIVKIRLNTFWSLIKGSI